MPSRLLTLLAVLVAYVPAPCDSVLSRGQRLLATEVSDARSALSLLPQALANRTLLLTGDSVTRHLFHELLKLIAVPHEPRTTVVNPIGNLVSCHEWKSAFRLLSGFASQRREAMEVSLSNAWPTGR